MNHARASSHLKADGSGWSREAPRTLVSLLSKQTLLTSGTRLSISTLHEESHIVFITVVITGMRKKEHTSEYSQEDRADPRVPEDRLALEDPETE